MKKSKKRFIDPWGAALPESYERIIKDFGIESFSKFFQQFPEPNLLMRRGIVFGGRDLKIIADAIKNKKTHYVLSGIMPSAQKIHLGNKLVIDNIKYFQEHGAKTYVLIADLEAAATRSITIEEARKNALEYQIPAYIALGLDIKKTIFYFQSKNRSVVSLAYSLSSKATMNEFRAIYGDIDASRIMSSVLQVADILYPQLKEKRPGIIPVGIDQDPHIRLTRDIVSRTKKLGFFMPSSIYHHYTPALDGSLKMSKSKQNYIELPEDDKSIEEKLKNAFSGGRESIEKQKKLGGKPHVCVPFELMKQHLIEDDKKLNKIFEECKNGRRLCKDCKQEAMALMKKFMHDFKKKFEKAKKQIGKVKFVEE